MPLFKEDRQILKVYDDKENNFYGEHTCRSSGTYVLGEIAKRGVGVPLTLCIDVAFKARQDCWCNIKQDW